MRAKFASRARILAAFFALIAIVIVVRLYLVQIVHGDEYRTRADNQHIAPTAHALDRGVIYFTDKSGELISGATLASGFTIAITPKLVKNPEKTYLELSASTSIDRAEFMAHVAKTDDPYEEVARRVKEPVGLALAKLELPGVSLLRERWRYYPAGFLASHELGILGQSSASATVIGQYGLERQYNNILARDDAGTSNLFSDLFKSIGISSHTDTSGGDVVTSIEPSVQAYLEDELARYSSTWHPRTVGGIIMDPHTGAILAMASRPTFDPNDLGSTNGDVLGNPMVERTYEFGSTMKPLTMAAAIDSHTVVAASTYNDTGREVIDGKTVSNFDGRARGVVPMQEILSQSLNIGISHIVQKMGTSVLRDYFERYGITEESGIDLPSEQSPQVSNLDSPRTLEYVTAGFGQGIAITPVAMARALSTLANHGIVPAPHIGVEARYPGALSHTLGWAPERRAIEATSADTVTRMLVTVVDTALKGGKAKVPEMSIAAKTGTAQIARPGGGGYYADRYLHSFFGYFPAYDAKFLIFFFAVEPVGAQYASDTWTDPFIRMTEFLTTYYAVPPDRPGNK